MYLKEIQTYGFKSFADKINFEFTNNINGIVGPNGSGKSNVVDAVRWVLGEASNKSLRASDNISVIFSGSKSRRPLNSAMVNIIFDNTDRHLPIDFNEVSIKRVLYRTGENEYYLNGEKCRLKDITELLTDSGAAKESFNIIIDDATSGIRGYIDLTYDNFNATFNKMKWVRWKLYDQSGDELLSRNPVWNNTTENIVVDEDINANEVLIYDVVRDFTGIGKEFDKKV